MQIGRYRGAFGAAFWCGVHALMLHVVCRYDSKGEEGADKCSWKYGETWQASNGALANMKLNGKSYLIQMNWAIGQGCSMGW